MVRSKPLKYQNIQESCTFIPIPTVVPVPRSIHGTIKDIMYCLLVCWTLTLFPVNLGQLGTPSQSSTYSGLTADLAVDDDVATCSGTSTDVPTRWQTTFSAGYSVHTVVLQTGVTFGCKHVLYWIINLMTKFSTKTRYTYTRFGYRVSTNIQIFIFQKVDRVRAIERWQAVSYTCMLLRKFPDLRSILLKPPLKSGSVSNLMVLYDSPYMSS